MIRLAANLSFLYPDRPFLERFAAAAADGFTAIEWNFAYDIPTAALKDQLDRHGLRMCLINTPPGDLAAGELGLAVLPGREDDVDAAVGQALDQAVALDVPMIHFLAGRPPAGMSPAAADNLFLANLGRAAARARQAGRMLTLEALNPIDRPGYHIVDVGHALRLIAACGQDNVRLQLDLYNAMLTEEDVIATIERCRAVLAHVQLAGVPGRHEPDVGELPWRAAIERLEALGYDGFLGCEYRPQADTSAGLGWARPHLAGAEA